MIWALDFALLLFMIICAIAAITVRDLLHATIILAAYSLIMTVLWSEMNPGRRGMNGDDLGA